MKITHCILGSTKPVAVQRERSELPVPSVTPLRRKLVSAASVHLLFSSVLTAGGCRWGRNVDWAVNQQACLLVWSLFSTTGWYQTRLFVFDFTLPQVMNKTPKFLSPERCKRWPQTTIHYKSAVLRYFCPGFTFQNLESTSILTMRSMDVNSGYSSHQGLA